ncbi:alpha/beta hydrolase [Bifidobacterium olomucense]|uniref:Esterase n=1 Tax=Bifidobacterium olomucense TaxID=2675324 RepID=A0A7Y0EYX1_9BIFI|nr:alpha/beta hydrolase-fold protein [Bifidobacterium sp. DSM 109959]NMM98932.1 esterase [Bifidobacterium sp. DSM 109959]
MQDSVWMKTMMGWSLVGGVLPWTVFGVTALVAVVLLMLMIAGEIRHRSLRVAPASAPSGSTAHLTLWSRPLPLSTIVMIAAAIIGTVAAWLISDVFMVFGVSLGWSVICTIGAGIAALGFAIAAAARTHRMRRVCAIVLVPLILMSTGLGVDGIYGEYQTVGSLVGYAPYASIDSVDVHKSVMSVAQWLADAQRDALPDMPQQGKVLTVDIPNTKSDFNARRAMIYLPPAALSKQPPALPVMELLAGQPGSPGRLIAAGGIAAMMDSYAAGHHGLAPIVLVPDQNGADTHNSLCADTTQGNAETYLTQDVVTWAKRTLPVATDASMWAIGGFSQGGTCTTQLAPRHPEIYGAMLPVDGELKPTNGTVDEMVRNYFAGDRTAYDAQVPVNAIAATGSSSQALFAGAGERDSESITNMRTIAAAARKAGMEVTELLVPNTGHDWHAVQAVWKPGLEWFGQRTGLGTMTKPLKDYSQVEVLQ